MIRRHLAICFAMLIASGMASALKPVKEIPDQGAHFELETMIPASFGDWQVDRSAVASIVNPQTEAKLEQLYGQTLSRTYHDGAGRKVMLSLAYGGNQTKATEAHRPEVCYPAQGFHILGSNKTLLHLGSHNIPAMRLMTVRGNRYESVTYWISVGGDIVRGRFEQKLAMVRHGLTGKIPDGLLFRVSSIGRDEKRENALHDSFLSQLLEALSPESRGRLVGSVGQMVPS